MSVPSLAKVLQYKNPDLIKRFQIDFHKSQTEAEDALQELLKYLWLSQTYKAEKQARPHDESLNFRFGMQKEILNIDYMWHTFLLFTRNYADFCQQYFGEFIHHNPNMEERKPGMQGFLDESERYLSYVYDKLGEETLLKWFAEHFDDSKDDQQFWLNKWEQQQIGFHFNAVNPGLIRNYSRLNLQPQDEIFVPLCGKSLDMIWLAQQGLTVVGIELSEIAVTDFFKENHLTYKKESIDHLTQYSSEKIIIYCGNFFDLKPERTGKFAAIYDSASLYALPQHLRHVYVAHLQNMIAPKGKLLLNTLEYESSTYKDNPPYSLSSTDINELFSEGWKIEMLEEGPLQSEFYPRALLENNVMPVTHRVFLITKL